ncbi:shikimate dehydrogenase family protein [Paraburkholderia sp. ZP32-5]|uniref:shikimate dehydrogenase family protein n=1 Tax=Paraburkholderia sp. ZP32-5 TaxID=2883245 RepID=UPI001F426CA0|nr:ThiF family adenylyltransferase [Paraburkholderia sp. ZP32-5]
MLRNLTGSTRLLGIAGDPVAQVLAPPIWTTLFQRNGMDAVCVPMHVQPEDLTAFLKGAGVIRNLDGLIVTVPYKPIVASLIDKPTERASLAGSVNVMRWEQDGSTCGDVLDGVGFVNGLAARGQDVKGKRALVVGCGGVGSAMAFALAAAGIDSVSVADTEPARALKLAARLTAKGFNANVAPAVAAHFDLIATGTPMGMKEDDPLPLDCTWLRPGTIVCEAVMHPVETPLLKLAAAAGCFVQPGTYLLDYQLQLMAQFFGFDVEIELPQAQHYAV